jgi:hypothetical protein
MKCKLAGCDVQIADILTAKMKKANIYLATGYCSAECNSQRTDKVNRIPVVFAVPESLQASVAAGAATTNYRAEIARLLNIKDKNHAPHGSNFNQAQSKWQIIANLMEPVQGELRTTAEATLETTFKWYPGK